MFEPEWTLRAWITWIFVTVYFLPFLVLAFCYSRICHVVWLSVDAKYPSTGCTGSKKKSKDGRKFPWITSSRYE